MKVKVNDFQLESLMWVKEVFYQHNGYNNYSYGYLYDGKHYDGTFNTSTSVDDEQWEIDLIELILSDISKP
jgi:hypothetical protein